MMTLYQYVYPDEFDEFASGARAALQVDRKKMFTVGDVVVICELCYTSTFSSCASTGRQLVLEVTHVLSTWPETVLSVRLVPAPGG